MIKKYLFTALSIILATDVYASSYDSDDDLNNGDATSPFRNESKVVEKARPQPTLETDDLKSIIERMGREVRMLASAVDQWSDDGNDEWQRLKLLRKGFELDPSTTPMEMVQSYYPMVRASKDRTENEFKDMLAKINMRQYKDILMKAGEITSAEYMDKIGGELLSLIEKAARRFRRDLDNMIELDPLFLEHVMRPALSDEQKRQNALQAEAQRKAMEPILQSWKVLSDKLATESIFQAPAMSQAEACLILKKYPTKAPAMQARLHQAYATALEPIRSYKHAEEDGLGGITMESVQRLTYELQAGIDNLRKESNKGYTYHLRLIEALRVLGHLSLAHELEIRNNRSHGDCELMLLNLEVSLEKIVEQRDRIIQGLQATEADDGSDHEEDGPDLQSYYQKFQQCVNGQEPAADASLAEIVGYGTYLTQQCSVDVLKKKCGAMEYELLNQCCVSFVSGMFTTLLQFMGGLDDAQIISDFETRSVTMIHAFAKFLKLEVVSDDPAELRKVMKLVFKKLNGLK